MHSDSFIRHTVNRREIRYKRLSVWLGPAKVSLVAIAPLVYNSRPEYLKI